MKTHLMHFTQCDEYFVNAGGQGNGLEIGWIPRTFLSTSLRSACFHPDGTCPCFQHVLERSVSAVVSDGHCLKTMWN